MASVDSDSTSSTVPSIGRSLVREYLAVDQRAVAVEDYCLHLALVWPVPGLTRSAGSSGWQRLSRTFTD
jgi:hypothetical protein